jgi:hypothetical protein
MRVRLPAKSTFTLAPFLDHAVPRTAALRSGASASVTTSGTGVHHNLLPKKLLPPLPAASTTASSSGASHNPTAGEPIRDTRLVIPLLAHGLWLSSWPHLGVLA